MAISKQRLKELIEQGATIYDISSKKYVGQRKLDKFAWIDDDCLCFDKTEYPEMAYLQDLFETEEDACWELEMTATRTETLKLPTWDKFKFAKIPITFIDKIGDKYVFYGYENKIRICYVNNDGCEIVDKEYLATKENYLEACKLCLRLFRGEEV